MTIVITIFIWLSLSSLLLQLKENIYNLRYIRYVPNNVRISQLRRYRKRQSEADEVWPIAFDKSEPPVQLPSHIAPFILEGIKGVKKAHVNERKDIADRWQWYLWYEHSLAQKQSLHQNTEQHVGYEFTHARQ